MKVFYVDTSFLNTGSLSAPADCIYLPLYTHTPLCASRQTLKHTDTNEHKHSRNANPLVHIRYTIFSSCFSSAFPNGWLNQLCGAWFKSSGMLGYCQRLVRQQGGNIVAGGEQLPLPSLKSASIRTNLRSTEWKRCFLSGQKNDKMFHCHQAPLHRQW